jgi:hypothetical protein
MPGPEVRLHTLRRATQLFGDTPGRRGRLVELQDVDDVLVAGDLHGNLENFKRLLHRADLANHPRRHLVLQELIHGPFLYPAGGDKSHQLVDLVAALKGQYPRQVHFLLGNHELAQATGRRISKDDRDLNDLFREGVGTAYLHRAPEIYAAYLDLFAVVPLALRTPNSVFLSHSLPGAGHLLEFDPAALERQPSSPADLAPGGSVYALVWDRDVRPETVSTFLGKVGADLLITGHIPCEEGFARPSERHLILDSLGAPAACCLFPADRPLSPDELASCVQVL